MGGRPGPMALIVLSDSHVLALGSLWWKDGDDPTGSLGQKVWGGWGTSRDSQHNVMTGSNGV